MNSTQQSMSKIFDSHCEKNYNFLEFQNYFFRWIEMPAMREPRYLATTVLDEAGKMWVLGGYADNDPKKGTELFKYRPPPRKGKVFLSNTFSLKNNKTYS